MQIQKVDLSVYRIPTDRPEADGTIDWNATTLVLAEVTATSGQRGLGFAYADAASATIIRQTLAPLLIGLPAWETGRAWELMVNSVRNLGRPGVAAGAISAVDVALWDLKARLIDRPLFQLLGAHRNRVPIYGSGGFTTYSPAELATQLGGWAAQGIPRVKMKIGKGWGTALDEDVERVRIAREAIGPNTELFVDANGGYTAKQAVRQAARFAEYGVTYFEEPVSSDQLEQLAFVRQQIAMDVAAGEYGYDPWYFRRMLRAEAVDILQADVTRCLGCTGWLMAADLAYSFDIPFSAHTAPSLHAHVGCAAPQLAHVEYFYDHVRMEQMLFDGVLQPVAGHLQPDPDRPGLGLTLKRQDAEAWRIG